MKQTQFFICEHCKNLVGMIDNKGVPLMCCGQKMTELVAGSVEASLEKHIPVVTVKDNAVEVCVGEAIHPMTDEHKIDWVYLKTDKGGQRKNLNAGDEPKVKFALIDEKPLEVYAYCNLHGLWKKEL